MSSVLARAFASRDCLKPSIGLAACCAGFLGIRLLETSVLGDISSERTLLLRHKICPSAIK
jgi:hypothetical protein